MDATAERTERDIRKNILDNFYWDGRLNAKNIEVEVYGNRIVLLGSVPTAANRCHAEEDARSVAGVAGVDNRLEVKFTDDVIVPSDLELEQNIRNIIRWNSGIDTSKMKIAVNAGFATLEGTVCSYYQKFRAEELAADVIGVTRVDNRLVVVPSLRRPDEDIAERIITKLKQDLGMDADSLTVMVSNGVITLTGHVRDVIALSGVLNIVRNTHGIVDIQNYLTLRRP